MDPIHEGSGVMHATCWMKYFPMHDIQVDGSRSQMGVKVEVVHEDQWGPSEGTKFFYDLLGKITLYPLKVLYNL